MAYDALVRKQMDLDLLAVVRVFCPRVAEPVEAALARYVGSDKDEAAVTLLSQSLEVAWKNQE